MRCPKCGYISYDRLQSCSKCKSDLTAVSEKLHGTTLNVEAPDFLAMTFGEAAAEQRAAVGEAGDAPVYLEEEISVPLAEEEGEEEEIKMRPTGLQDIDVSDLVPLSDDEELSAETAESSMEGSAPEDAEEESREEGIPFAGISAASLLAPEEEPSVATKTEEGAAAATGEEEVVDLSDLMSGAQEQAGEGSGTDLTLDLTLTNDSEEQAPEQEEINFDFEAGLQGPAGLPPELEKDDEEEEARLSDLDLKLEMDDEHV